jgi:hypothetical protein
MAARQVADKVSRTSGGIASIRPATETWFKDKFSFFVQSLIIRHAKPQQSNALLLIVLPSAPLAQIPGYVQLYFLH